MGHSGALKKWDRVPMNGQFVAEIMRTDSSESNALKTSSSDLISEMVFSSSRSTRAATVKSFYRGNSV